MQAAVKHPAKFSPAIIEAAAYVIGDEEYPRYVLDPFAGTGRVHELKALDPHLITVGNELEFEWADMAPRGSITEALAHWCVFGFELRSLDCKTVIGDATDLMFEPDQFDIVFTSPPYANRMADRDMRPSVAATYMKALGRTSSEGSANHLQWGVPYQELMRAAGHEMYRVLKPGGFLLLNVSDHVRAKQVVDVTGWFKDRYTNALGFQLLSEIRIPTPRMRRGANGDARVEHELLLVMSK